MAEAVAEISVLDNLIAGLEAIIIDSDDSSFSIIPGSPPLKATLRPIGVAARNMRDRTPRPADAVSLVSDRLIAICLKTNLTRLAQAEASITLGKTGRGEVFRIIQGIVQSVKKIRGGYELEVKVEEMRKEQVTPGQRLREALEKNDASIWNRWCADIKDNIDLAGINLANADLTGYDLCCAVLSNADLSGADLSGAILSGADLSTCALDNVKVTGTDLFRARLSRKYASLISASGTPEAESVIFID